MKGKSGHLSSAGSCSTSYIITKEWERNARIIACISHFLRRRTNFFDVHRLKFQLVVPTPRKYTAAFELPQNILYSSQRGFATATRGPILLKMGSTMDKTYGAMFIGGTPPQWIHSAKCI
jgi:hypothetical protein